MSTKKKILKSLEAQSETFRSRIEVFERAIRQDQSLLRRIRCVRGTRWKNVRHVKLKHGRLYIVRRRIGKTRFAEAAAEWSNGAGWCCYFGSIPTSTAVDATVDVLV